MEIGTRLREARERRGLTLRDIADVTKISIHTLEKLERNDTKRLPGGIFLRGYLRAFASQVGLDGEAVVTAFVAETGAPPDAGGAR